MNKTLNKFINCIKDTYENVDDYILKNNFNELKKNYNVKELQQKNIEIIEQNQEVKSDTLQDNLPRDTLDKAGIAGGIEETKGTQRKWH